MEELAATPHVIDALVTQKFRAVAVEAGDCTGVALSDKGELRIWGTFRVSNFHTLVFALLRYF